VSGAQRHDVKLLEPTLAAIVVGRPKVQVQHLCADKGYVGKPAEMVIVQWGYVPHVRQRGEESRAKKHKRWYRPKRWVVERTHSWLNRFRKLLVRYEKLAASYEGLLEIACAIIVFQRSLSIYG
jgi:putative transposase